ncbi:MAG: hypothetical protein LUD79_04645 [Oscillospiraceae bacterium]|nr:hypothetical protein [Oscillospiraceae bacterium]
MSQRFDHVLRDTSKVGKTTRNSPGLISAAICVAFYVLAVRFLGQTLWAVLQWHINLMDTPIYMAVVIAVALTAVVGFKWYCNTVIKGIYRSYMLRRLKKSQSSQNKKIQNALNGLQPDAWFDQYTGMISRDRAQMARNPETPLLQLETGRLLANVPKKTIFSIVGADLKPWPAYSPQGENRGVWLPLLMIALMVWQNFFG